MKIFLYDLETTGLLYWKHGIHRMSYMIIKDNEVILKRDLKIAPNPLAQIDPSALKIAGVTEAEIKAYMPMEQGYKQLTTDLGLYCDKYNSSDKYILCGFNIAHFDNDFFSAFFKQNKDEYFASWFYAPPLDLYVLSGVALAANLPNMTRFTLGAVAEQFGITVNQKLLHQCPYDLELAHKILLKLTNI